MSIRFWNKMIGLAIWVIASELVCLADTLTLDDQFALTVFPILESHCFPCHDFETQEAKLDLARFKTAADVTHEFKTWEHVLSRVRAKEMPPIDSDVALSTEERETIVGWIQKFRRQEATRNAGDPGVVLVRRLSNAEYNHSIRDLTGFDIDLTRSFPVDPANEAGFDNSSESLSMSPALLNKYLEAARFVSHHLVLKPNGFEFAPHPVSTETDRDKYCVKRIVEFYYRQPTDLADYFLAAWRYRQIIESGVTDVSLDAVATQARISPKYLPIVWKILTERGEQHGPLAHLQRLWSELPVELGRVSEAREGCVAMRDFVVSVRRTLEPILDNLKLEGIHPGSQPFVLWKNDEYAKYRRSFNVESLIKESDLDAVAAWDSGDPIETTLIVPSDENQRARYEQVLTRFCDVFPDRFYVSERGRDYGGKARDEQEKGRLLSAGFHSMMGYYRDDAPLCDLILSEAEREELDDLWRELDFVTGAPIRQYSGFVWFERAESRYMREADFDFARAEDKSVNSPEMIRRLSEAYLAKAKLQMKEGIPIQAIESYFERMDRQIRWIESARLKSQPSHLEGLERFASRAWRRPLSDIERQQIENDYASLRNNDGVSHDDAIQDCLVTILMSPHFCYRVDYATEDAERRPLSDLELASRLSFFLWSSIPDEVLLSRANEGNLRDPKFLTEEVHRMVRDPRIRGLATEFAASWLDFRRFDEHNSVDRNRFPMFTDTLRQAMSDEPIHFFLDVVQNDRSVLDFLYAKHTFVNAELARHYGIPEPTTNDPGDWVRVDKAWEYGRGGLLPMSVFLTKNAPGLRTSPVKRGYWVVKRLLGETIPPPPPNVPELPSDEAGLGEKSLREALANHRQHASCAGCHNRIDSIGLVFEGFGPIGERRELDLGGRRVETLAAFPDGSQGEGVAALQVYIQQSRQQEFVDNLCRKLLCFALGRSLGLSDDPLIEEMQSRLKDHDFRFGVLIESIVTSTQFLEKRSHVFPENQSPTSTRP